MKRHTRWSLLLGAVVACIGMAGLHRVAKRTAYRYRLMAPVLKHASPRDAQLTVMERFGLDEEDATEYASLWKGAA